MNYQKSAAAVAVLLAGVAPMLLLSSAESEAQTSTGDVACTETPDCASLGYTKNSTQCPDGGIKCPFDGTKMFCVSGEALDYVFQSKVALYDVAYSDGTSSSTYNSNKQAIGLVFHVHDTPEKNHAWLVSLEQFTASTRAEAVKKCAGYSIKGTKAGDWHLADAGELLLMGKGNGTSDHYAGINNALKKIPGAEPLGTSYNPHYCASGAADASKTYINGSPSCTAQTKSTQCTTTGSCDTSGSCTGSKSGSCSLNSLTCYRDSSLKTPIGSANPQEACLSRYGTPYYSGGISNNITCSSCTVNKSCTVTKTCNAGFGSIPATSIYSSTVYWSISDPIGSTNNIAVNINTNNGWTDVPSPNAKYGHFRCVAHL